VIYRDFTVKSRKKTESFGKIPLFTPLSFYFYVFFILILPLGTVFGASINVLTNPGFETGNTTGWSARGTGVAISAGSTSPTPHSGTYRGRANGRTETWHGIQQNVLGKMVVGQTYQMSGWVRIASGNDTVMMSVQKTDCSGTTWTNVGSVSASSSGWVQLPNNNYTLTVNGTLMELLVYFETQTSATVNIYVDDVSVYGPQVSPPSPNATGNVNATVRHQTLEGFGAAGGWYENWLTDHPNKDALYDILFGQLGLDIYRLRNTYGQDGSADYMSRSDEIITAAGSSLGHPIKILISSWSPPASLKSNNDTNGFPSPATLKGGPSNYVYSQFGDWWADSIAAWAGYEISADYISIQNETDYETTWDSCRFEPTQTSTYAGYNQAFEAVYNELYSRFGSGMPKMLAPETTGFDGASGSSLTTYCSALTNPAHVYGYAHHLYNPGNGDSPDGYLCVMSNFAASYGSKPLFQTEYSHNNTTFTDAMNLAILMHNSLTVESVVSYMYWDLFWETPSGLVSFPSYGDSGYTINPVYYAFKHFSKFTDPGWQRVDADTNSTNLRISSYISPGNSQLSVVIINTSTTTDINLTLSFTGYTFTNANVYRSSSTQNCVLIGTVNPTNPIILPANTITTIACFNPDITPPAAPTGLTATGGELMVSLNWNDNGELDLAGYNVYRSLTSGSGYAKINGSLVTSSDYIDNSVNGYVTYYYVVRAVDSSLNESGNSNQASATPTDTTPPLAPTGLYAIPGNGTVTLNWSDNGESDLAGYNVYRSTTSGSGYVRLNGSLLTSSDYIDNTVTNGITYYYVVTAVDIFSNESNASSEVSATPQIFVDVNIIGSWISGTTHAKEAGINRALVFFVHSEYSNTGVSLNSVTYGGRTMTKIIDRLLTGPSNGVYAAAFILNDANIVAADGSGTFIPSWTGSPSGIAYSSVFLGDVNQAALVGASASASGTTSSTITTSALATNIGDLVIEAAAASSTGDFTLNNNFIKVNEYVMSSSEGVDGYKNAIGVPETPSITNTASRKVLIGFVVKAQELPPNYSNCGEVIAAGHRLPSDLNGDCYVNYLDVNTIAYYWLNGECNAGNNYCGLSDFEPRDGAVDFFDFSDFAMQWLECNNPENPECPHNW
jgi:glucuronoarabinoxylan endo-1,4-beta-xylanase